MSKRPTQQKRKRFAERRHQRALSHGTNRECPNCHRKLGPKESGHFVPPSFGDPGMFICDFILDNNLKS